MERAAFEEPAAFGGSGSLNVLSLLAMTTDKWLSGPVRLWLALSWNWDNSPSDGQMMRETGIFSERTVLQLKKIWRDYVDEQRMCQLVRCIRLPTCAAREVWLLAENGQSRPPAARLVNQG